MLDAGGGLRYPPNVSPDAPVGRPAATRVLSPVLIVVFVAATTMVAATAVRTACLVRLVNRPGTEGWCGTQIPDLLITERLTQGRWFWRRACAWRWS